MATDTNTESDLTTDAREAAIAESVAQCGAERVEGLGLSIYVEQGEVTIVSDDDMVELAGVMEDDDGTAYSLWCASHGESVELSDIADMLGHDAVQATADKLEREAGAAGDTHTSMVLGFWETRELVMALVAELAEKKASESDEEEDEPSSRVLAYDRPALEVISEAIDISLDHEIDVVVVMPDSSDGAAIRDALWMEADGKDDSTYTGVDMDGGRWTVTVT